MLHIEAEDLKIIRRSLRQTLALLLLFAAAPAILSAQELLAASDTLPNAPSFLQTAIQSAPASVALAGTVTDIAGALVPGAAIVLESPGQSAHHATSDGAGRFSFAGLPAGTYHAIIAAPGMESLITQPVTLQPGQHYEFPTLAMAVATGADSIVVGGNSAEVAEAELKIETQQRTLGIFPNFRTSYIWNAAPLNPRQKFKLTYRTIADPVSYIGIAIRAGIQTGRDTYPSWGQDAPSYGKRFAADFGDSLFSRGFDSALFPIVFHQDPRYFYMGPSQPTGKRIIHAIQSGVICRGDNGHLQPNVSHWIGNASAGALSTVYHPAGTSAQQLALTNSLLRIGFDGLDGLLREFVLPYLVHHKPAYASGQPSTDKP